MGSWLLSEKLFRDRQDAGKKLARHLRRYAERAPIVLGLPRGGVPVAYEVARALDAPLDVCVVRKIGAPFEPELGIGAVAEDGAVWVNREAMKLVGVTEQELRELIAEKQAEVAERVQRFREGAPPLDVTGRLVLVVDDGIATGGTAHAALVTLRARGAARVVLAVPVGAAESLGELTSVADEVVCPHAEEAFYAVGQWYEDFEATSDDDVVQLLHASKRSEGATAPSASAPLDASSTAAGGTAGASAGEAPSVQPGATPSSRSPRSEPSERAPASERATVRRNVQVPVGERMLEGQLTVPARARGLILFAHGSGSGRLSPRNQYVAGELQQLGLGTLLVDLLTQEEEAMDALTGHLRFDIGLLASRLVAATEWSRLERETRALDLGYFGASTGAAAALIGAAERAEMVHAVVARGGRPDLAEQWLPRVKAPTLLIVGGEDDEVITLNEDAFDRLECPKELEIVPNATHLFPEPGALERVAELAGAWFTRHLGRRALRATDLHA